MCRLRSNNEPHLLLLQGPSWSSLDYGGGWKLLHYFARRFFAPLLLWGYYHRASSTVHLHLISDLTHALEGTRHSRALIQTCAGSL